jgi:hypothetical protein
MLRPGDGRFDDILTKTYQNAIENSVKFQSKTQQL